MYNSTFLPPPKPGSITIPNPYHPIPDYLFDNYHNYHSGFEVSHHHDLHLEVEQPVINNMFEDSNNSSFTPYVSSQSLISTQEITSTGSSASSADGMPMDNQMQEERKRDKKRAKGEGHVIAIRTQTELETLDDGYKWRKYGKKTVKSNPNPRHYYKCSINGCKVKKRVERDGEDSSYLITTYDGRHNHDSPCVVYCDRLPFLMDYEIPHVFHVKKTPQPVETLVINLSHDDRDEPFLEN